MVLEQTPARSVRNKVLHGAKWLHWAKCHATQECGAGHLLNLWKPPLEST